MVDRISYLINIFFSPLHDNPTLIVKQLQIIGPDLTHQLIGNYIKDDKF